MDNSKDTYEYQALYEKKSMQLAKLAASGDYGSLDRIARLLALEDAERDLHASIIEQGRLVQIGASGESKYGAMSAGEYIEWVKGRLGE